MCSIIELKCCVQELLNQSLDSKMPKGVISFANSLELHADFTS